MKSVFVLGGINMDYIMHVDRLPSPGESRPGHDFISSQGGKGANQAIAAKKLGIKNVYMIGSLGEDNIKTQLLSSLKSYGINTEAVETNGVISPTVMILFDDKIKDNYIVINDASNMLVDKFKVESFLREMAKPGDIFMSSLENNFDAVLHAFKIAKTLGLYTIFNPAPAHLIDEEIYKYVDLIVVNESECETLTSYKISDEKDATCAYKYLNERGIDNVIITLGSKGSYYINNGITTFTNARKVETVDTTSAGDTFIGAIASRIIEGYSIRESLDFASLASSITVSREGSAMSIPTLDEVLSLLDKNK